MASVTCCLALVGTSALAQDQGQAQEDAEVSTVVITGSRAVRDGSNAPTPVTVLSTEEMRQSSPRNLAEAIASLPEFRGSNGATTPTYAAGQNYTGSFLNLRGLGIQRTLILLDGRRVAPSAASGASDFNLLPQPLIQRVDIVTGGASAAYGSDAVAGVVNVILDTKFTGIKGGLQGGISDKGDAGSWKADLTVGASYLDDRLHVVASAGLSRNDGVNDQLERDWALDGRGLLAVTPAQSSQTTQRLFYNARQRAYPGGVILDAAATVPPALRNLMFLPGGVVGAYNPGTNNTAVNQIGGDGVQNSTALSALLEMQTGFFLATYEVSDDLEVYLQGSYAESHTRWRLATDRLLPPYDLTIYEGNAYLPGSVATLLSGAAPLCGATRCFKMSKVTYDWPNPTGDTTSEAIDLVAGFRAEIFGGYRLSGYIEHGENQADIYTNNNFIWERVFAAVDAIANPSVGGVAGVAAGAPVCRVSVTNPGLYPGCVAMNIFGFGQASPQSIDYVVGDSLHSLRTVQDVVAIDLAGEPFSLPAGPVSAALGAEYRQYSVRQVSDPLSQIIKTGTGIRGFPVGLVGLQGGYQFTNQQPFAGQVEVKEVYGEIALPLLKDLPLVQELELNLAGRYTDYSTSGGVKTYKVGLSYRPTEDIRLRGTYSRDIRAPSAIELFQGNGQGAGGVRDDTLGGITYTTFFSTRGNRDLTEETADTYSAGLIFTPRWLPGVSATVDYYRINIADAIGTVTPQTTLDLCFKGNAAFCNNIIRTGAGGQISRILQPYLNLAEQEVEGVDFELGYRGELPGLPGNFGARALFGYLATQNSQPFGSAPQRDAGEVGRTSNPRFRGVLRLTWDNGPVSLFLQHNYVGHGLVDADLIEGRTIYNNQVGSRSTFDVTGRYRFGGEEQYEAFITVNNLFDKDPPTETTLINPQAFNQVNSALYDTIGRYYTTGLRFKF